MAKKASWAGTAMAADGDAAAIADDANRQGL